MFKNLVSELDERFLLIFMDTVFHHFQTHVISMFKLKHSSTSIAWTTLLSWNCFHWFLGCSSNVSSNVCSNSITDNQSNHCPRLAQTKEVTQQQNLNINGGKDWKVYFRMIWDNYLVKGNELSFFFCFCTAEYFKFTCLIN